MQLKIYRSETIDSGYKRFFQDLSLLRDGRTRHIIIVPDRMTLNCEQQLFVELNEKCFFDVEVVTLSRLSNKYIQKAGFEQKVLSKIGATAVIKKILLENADKFDIFGKACKQEDFANVMFNTISMLKSCLISPERLNFTYKNAVLNKKLAEIKLVYEKYEEFLQTNYVDSFNRLNLFTKLIDRESFGDACIYFLGHNDFTPQMMSVMTKFIKTAKSVNVLLCDGGEKAKGVFGNQMKANLISLAEMIGCSYDIVECENSLVGVSKEISENFFAETNKNLDGVEILKFDNIEDEVEHVAKQIRHAIVFNSEKYKNFTVITSSLGTYKPYIEKIFRKYDIPCFVDMSENFAENAVVRYIKSILNLVLLNKQREGFDILKNPLSVLPIDQVFKYENDLLKIGVIDCFAGKPCEEIEEFLNVLRIVAQKSKDCRTVSEYVQFVRMIYQDLKLEEKIEKLIETYLSQEEIYQARILQQIPNKLEKVLSEIEKILSDYQCEAKTFVEILSACDGLNLTLPPIESDSVFVADYNTSFVQPDKYVFVLGANEGSFPQYEIDAGLISDIDIAEMDKDIKLSPTIKQVNKRLKFKAYETLLKATDKMWISYPSGTDGAFLSSTVLKLVKNFNGVIIQDGSIKQHSPYGLEVDFVQNALFNNICKNTAEKNFVEALANIELYESIPNYVKYLNSLYNTLPLGKELLNNRRRKNNKQNIENIKEVFFKKGTTSVSQFERYYKCPYIHFVDYGIKLKRKEIGEIESLDIGNIFHEYVRDILPILKKNKDKYSDKEQLYALAEDCFEKVLKMEQFEALTNNASNNFTLYSLREESKRIAEALLEDLILSKYEPIFLEKEFLYDGGIKGKNGVSVKIRGFIDRIDVFDNKFRIIDYKTGSDEFKNYTSLKSGKKLQLFIYEKVFEKDSGYRPVGAFYMPLSNNFAKDDEYGYKLKGVMSSNLSDIVDMDSSVNTVDGKSKLLQVAFKEGKISGKGSNLMLSSEQISNLGEFAFKKVQQAMNDVCDGNIQPNPLKESGQSACTYCKYRGMCGFDESQGNRERVVENVTTYDGLEGEDEAK